MVRTFALVATNSTWLKQQLVAAQRAREMSVLFMHSYPADLREDRAALLQLIRDNDIKVVDMGHAHYNELANDGRTIYATTRSTGQI